MITARSNQKSDFQDGGRQTRNTYISAYIQGLRTKLDVFWVLELNGTTVVIARCNRMSEFQNDILKYALYISVSGLSAAILDFLFPFTSDSIRKGV